ADETFGEALGDLEGWGLGQRRGDRFVLTDRGFSLANRVGVRILECLTPAADRGTLALTGGEC
ncbi:MAG: hypothetical protein AAB368_01060, partial [bacterium]